MKSSLGDDDLKGDRSSFSMLRLASGRELAFPSRSGKHLGNVACKTQTKPIFYYGMAEACW